MLPTPMVVNASFTDAKADMPSAIFRDNHGSKVVEIFRKYNSDMAKAGRPYRYS